MFSVDRNFVKNEAVMLSGFDGYFGERLHWDECDKKVILSQEKLSKLAAKLPTLHDNFRIHFWQSNNKDYDLTFQKGLIDQNWVKENTDQDFVDFIQSTASLETVNVIMTNNMSDINKISIKSPWMVAHRVAHVLMGGHETIEEGNRFNNCFNTFIKKFSRLVYDNKIEHPNYLLEEENLNNFGTVLGNMLGTMKSARAGKLVNRFEWIYESFAQFLILGKIRFNRKIEMEIPDLLLRATDRSIGKALPAILRFERAVNVQAVRVIDAATGKIFLM